MYRTISIIPAMLFCGLLFPQQERFPEWKEGIMELHHISTGRGDAAYYIFPDGTTMLVDAGDTSETHPRTRSDRNTPLLPNRSNSAPEWIADYIRQFHPKNRPVQLDYVLITHYHDDHFGEMDSVRTFYEKGHYFLTGITEVGSLIPVRMLLDRGYSYPIDLKDKTVQNNINGRDSYGMIPTLQNYWKFLAYQSTANGLTYQAFIPGTNKQIILKYKAPEYPVFFVQNIAANGKVWTGERENTYDLFRQGEYQGENPLSTCIKITYGKFNYFTGGDINGVDANGESDFNRIESQIAPVIGPVDVATLNHHGNRDSQNIYYVRILRPRIWIGQSWSSDHPDNNVLRRLLSTDLYPGERDLFTTAMLDANKNVIGDLVNKYKSLHGHVVVRVFDKGNKYTVYVLNDLSEDREVLAKFGPYESR